MKKNKNIVTFTYWYVNCDGNPCKYDGYELRPAVGINKVCAVIGLWRKETLLQYLDVEENPWQWEFNGTIRSYKTKGEFYNMQEGIAPVFPYNFGEYGLFNGKWLEKTVELFKNNNIEMDFSKRGFYDSLYWGLNNSIINVFYLKSCIYAYYPFRNINAFQEMNDTFKNGRVVQTYKIGGAQKFVYWKIGNYKDFGIKNLSVTFQYKDKTSFVATRFDKNIGNFHIDNNTLLFFEFSPYIILEADSDKEIKNIKMEFEVVFPLPIDCYNKYRGKQLQRAYDEKFIPLYLELNLCEGMNKSFRVNSSLCQSFNENFEESKFKFHNKIIKRGKIRQTYTLSLDEGNYMCWRASQHSAYAVKNFKVSFVDNNKKVVLGKEMILSKHAVVNNMLLFEYQPNDIVFKLPQKVPNDITVEAKIIYPIPFKSIIAKPNRFLFYLMEFVRKHTKLELRIKIGNFFKRK